MKWKWKSLVVSCFLLVATTMQSPAASAASVYDDLVAPVNSPVIGGTTACPAVSDISRTWYSLIKDSSLPFIGSSGDRSGFLSALDTAVDNGAGVSLIQESAYDENVKYSVEILVTSGAQPATFKTYSSYLGNHDYLSVPNTMLGGIYIDSYDSCKLKLHFNSSLGERVLAQHEDLAYCYGGFCYERQPVFINNPVSYPSGYEGVETPTSQPSAKYVAMGDSFSSGEGNPSFEAGTDRDGVNVCHRSPVAYPRLLEGDVDPSLGSTAFVACSGATTWNVLHGGSSDGAWSESQQVDALSSSTEVVTITIGGNDVGFEEYARQCVYAFCGPENPGVAVYDAVMDNIESEAFSQNLKTTYESILAHAPNANVYVIDYPYLFDPSGVDSTSCVVMDTSGAIPVQFGLNSTIKSAVSAVKAESTDYGNRLKLIESNAPTSPFLGSHLCTDDIRGAGFNSVDFGNQEYSFHPNVIGQQNYEALIKSFLP